MARVLQALLLIAGFCAPLLAAFAMESSQGLQASSANSFQVFNENTTGPASAPLASSATQTNIGLTDDTNGSSSAQRAPKTQGLKAH